MIIIFKCRKMIINVPEDILEYLFEYIYESDRWSLSKSNKYFYMLMKDNLIRSWMKQGKNKISLINLDKISINPENILVNECIFCYNKNLGVYISNPIGDEHRHLFISIEKSGIMGNDDVMFEDAIGEDEDGNIIRGIISYEAIVR